ncbi:MAG: signal recognition particle protein [Phycisphaerae bacterium]|jgi:signal recognition particle subunit SRP54
MFDQLSEKLNGVFRSIRGRGRITEANVREAMREIRTALLEADVHVQVARKFCDDCQEKAIGMRVLDTLRPEQVMVKVVHDELVQIMGPIETRIPFVSRPPTVILMAGLQGSGKTTTCAKLARYCMQKGKKPLLTAADLKRPAAIDQLEVLGEQVGVPVYTERDHQNAVKVCRNALLASRKLDRDVVILDTAGRLAIDEEMMNEVSQIANATQPHQIYLVLDAMTGQDAVNTAKAFDERLELDGAILTKFDSDTRGGAALSVKQVIGKPIKFIGVGEKLDAIEEFHPDRVAGRILGMGDVVGLVEKAQAQFDEKEALEQQKKMEKGTFGFDDFLSQLEKFRKMGPMKQILKMIPGIGSAIGDMEMPEEDLNRFRGIIHSMTARERRNPEVIEASRRRRIARGAGVEPQDVSGLVKQFTQMRGMMKQMAGLGMRDRMKFAQQMGQAGMMDGHMPKMKKGTTKYNPQRDKKRRRRKR